IPPTKHSVSSKIWLKETPESVLGPGKKDSNFATYQRFQVAMIKSRHVLTTALDYPEMKELNIIHEAVEPVTELEKQIQVDFKDSPEILRISMEGDNATELKVIVDAVTQAYLYNFEKVEEKSREEKLRKLQELKRSYAQKFNAKRGELSELAQGIKAPN